MARPAVFAAAPPPLGLVPTTGWSVAARAVLVGLLAGLLLRSGAEPGPSTVRVEAG